MTDELSSEDSIENEDEGPLLTFTEGRVLGVLLEKEATTPDYYPLTPNALHSACNQSSNREPVTDLGTDEVEEAMEGLRYKKLGVLVHQSGARVAKCKHTIESKFPYLTVGQRALLCVLLLRGQQTAGELRQRTERMHRFEDVARVESVLAEMAEYGSDPLVKVIPSGSGRRVVTYVHTLCGVEASAPAAAVLSAEPVEAAATWREEMESTIEALQAQVTQLSQELEDLKRNFGA